MLSCSEVNSIHGFFTGICHTLDCRIIEIIISEILIINEHGEYAAGVPLSAVKLYVEVVFIRHVNKKRYCIV